jgi:hypothetical protein
VLWLGLCLTQYPPYAEKKNVNVDFVLWLRLMDNPVRIGENIVGFDTVKVI